MAASRGLGKGLDALFQKTASSQEEAGAEGEYRLLSIDAIEANPQQPRKQISQSALEELSQSIRQQGLLQPILVRHRSGDRYQIVAGERRWRACKLAGLEEVPAILTELSDAESLVIGLIENLQREDLNPMEESEALHTLIRELDISQEALSEKIGRSRSSIANSLRLLHLDGDIQAALRSGRISTGQARTLLAVTDPEARLALFERVLQEQLTVREIEEIVDHWKQHGCLPQVRSARRPSQTNDEPEDRKRFLDYKRQLQKVLADRFDTKVQVSGQKDKGAISIKFRSESELQTILSRLGIDDAGVSRETQ
jgi:ParB family chromosome partitioning protein